jgi:hypothetical protein
VRKYENGCTSSGLTYLSMHLKRNQSDINEVAINSDSSPASPVMLNVFINFMSEENGEDDVAVLAEDGCF